MTLYHNILYIFRMFNFHTRQTIRKYFNNNNIFVIYGTFYSNSIVIIITAARLERLHIINFDLWVRLTHSFKLSGKEQDLEVEVGLLLCTEVTLTWNNTILVQWSVSTFFASDRHRYETEGSMWRGYYHKVVTRQTSVVATYDFCMGKFCDLYLEMLQGWHNANQSAPISTAIPLKVASSPGHSHVFNVTLGVAWK